jgi:hypothetical protein
MSLRRVIVLLVPWVALALLAGCAGSGSNNAGGKRSCPTCCSPVTAPLLRQAPESLTA